MKISAAEITQTSVLLAILLIFQYLGSITGNKPFIAVLVNFMLAVSALRLRSVLAVTIALTSPILAFILGIAQQPFLLPAIMLANTTFVLILSAVNPKSNLLRISGFILAAFIKFVILWFSVSSIMPLFINLPPEKMSNLVAMFSIPQFFTALAGAFFAMFFLRMLPVKTGAKNLQGEAKHTM